MVSPNNDTISTSPGQRTYQYCQDCQFYQDARRGVIDHRI